MRARYITLARHGESIDFWRVHYADARLFLSAPQAGYWIDSAQLPKDARRVLPPLEMNATLQSHSLRSTSATKSREEAQKS